ncbi:MAG: hypothetical protein AAGD33_24270 [Actinomycetota bacterium]
MTDAATTVNRAYRRHRFGPVELHLRPDSTDAVGPSGIVVRIGAAVTSFPLGDRLLGTGVPVEVGGVPAAHLRQPERGRRRRDRCVIVEPIVGSPLPPGLFFRLRWWRRPTLETSAEGLVARRFWPMSPHRPSTAPEVVETVFLLYAAGAPVVKASLGSAVAVGPPVAHD